MQRSTLSFLVFFLFLFADACSSDHTVPNTGLAKGNENELVDRYLNDLIANPQNQSEKDQNQIVNLLIDSLWDFRKTESGIYYHIEKAKVSKAGHPGLSSYITAHYQGTLLNGKEFDSSYRRQEPLQFRLNQVIVGWQEGIPLLRRGETGIFLIPSHLAYGEAGFGRFIPPHSVLRFDIKLLNYEDDPDDGF